MIIKAGLIFLTLAMVLIPRTARCAEKLQTAVFAGGCFWCMEPPFDKKEGVVQTESGYTGGHVSNPSYEQVSSGGTGHTEAIRITFDPGRISYEELLEIFWRNIDPLDKGGQFCDRGDQYRSGIFPNSEKQLRAALASRAEISRKLGKEAVTEITLLEEFHPAEEYHQDYSRKNPVRYKFYRYGCGRDARLKELWGRKN
ncbi:MAG TPA: peptide-methionine (S)-S-oxide reductase MsrA [Desulfomicrobiaceae bacterium]|nr:peptide-methionine (S)-S-oxide reductase MsrA [Desulfomicrobiaceae bacterium]